MQSTIAILGFLFTGLILPAQIKQSFGDNLPVSIIATVEPRHGKEIPTLHTEDFVAHHGSKRVPVIDAVPLQGPNAAVELFLLIDDSSATSLGSQLGELRRFLEEQPETVSVGVGYIRNGMAEIVQDFTTDHVQAAKKLRLPLSSGGAMSSPFLSLSDLIKRWSGHATRREVVLVSSGADPLGGLVPSNPYLDTAIDDAIRHSTVVYAIYTPAGGHFGNSRWRMYWAQNNLAKLCEETGGEAYMLGVGAPVAFEPYLKDIQKNLAHQYKVTFLMPPGNKGDFKQIRLSTEVPNADLVSATRVYVPARGRE